MRASWREPVAALDDAIGMGGVQPGIDQIMRRVPA